MPTILFALILVIPASCRCGRGGVRGPRSVPLQPPIGLRGPDNFQGSAFARPRRRRKLPGLRRIAIFILRPPSAARQNAAPADLGREPPSNAARPPAGPRLRPDPSHLSADPRVNHRAGTCCRTQPLCRGPGDPAAPGRRTIRTRRTCGFSWAWPPPGVPDARTSDEEREALLDEAIAAFRSILIRRSRDWCACAWNWPWPSISRRRTTWPATISSGPWWGKPARGPGRQRHPVFEGHAGPASLGRVVFRLLHCPGYQYQRRLGRAVHLYQRPAVPPGGRRAGPVPISASWAGAAVNTSIPWPTAGACVRGLNVNHREYKGNRWDQTFLSGYVGPRWLINRNTEMSLLATASQRWWGGSSLNYDYGARLEVQHRVFAGLRLSGRAQWSDRNTSSRSSWKGRSWCFPWAPPTCPSRSCRSTGWWAISSRTVKVHAWSSAGYWTRVGTNVALPWGFTVGLSAEFRWTDYEPRVVSVHRR